MCEVVILIARARQWSAGDRSAAALSDHSKIPRAKAQIHGLPCDLLASRSMLRLWELATVPGRPRRILIWDVALAVKVDLVGWHARVLRQTFKVGLDVFVQAVQDETIACAECELRECFFEFECSRVRWRLAHPYCRLSEF